MVGRCDGRVVDQEDDNQLFRRPEQGVGCRLDLPVADGHPGLAWLRFPAPDADGLYRFPVFSYGRRLARRHPDTTASGSPA